MKLTPIDIQQQQFQKKVRGYDPREVDTFLELIAEEMAQLNQRFASLEQQHVQTMRELEDHRKREVMLREAMLTAQQAMDDVKAQANKEAELIVSKAELVAERLTQNAHLKVTRILDDIGDLRQQRVRVIEELRSVVNTHLKLLSISEDQAKQDSETEEASVTVLNRLRAPSPPTSSDSNPADTAHKG